MKKNYEYLTQLRKLMKERGIDAAVISGTDPHQSEYTPAHWLGREWLTGFSSSNANAVVLPEEAHVWTDNRYFIAAEEALKDTGFTMMPYDGPNPVDMNDWITEHLQKGQKVGIDGTTFSIAWTQQLEQELNDNGIELVTNFQGLDEIWTGRAPRPSEPLFVHDESLVGRTMEQNVEQVMELVKSELANAVILSSLDDIAWVTNLRSKGDVLYSPIFVSYLYLGQDKRVLFVDENRITPEVKEHLQKYNVETRPYDNVWEFVASLPKTTRMLINPAKTARALYDNVGCTPVFGGKEIEKLKAIKNPTMIENFNTAMEKDGVALVKFFKWVEEEYPKRKLDEWELCCKLRELRLSDPSCLDESFQSIVGWNANGALPHYEPDANNHSAIEGDGLLVVDSGGQYLYGTTDITRTICLGKASPEMVHDYTLVLKGHIALATVVFPQGTRGAQLDICARRPLWEEGKAYYHGTGHGVGFFGNVHEGPHQIRTQEIPVVLEAGMTSSNEPGLYLTGRYGIRIENMMVIVNAMKTEFGQFLTFRNLTWFPYAIDLMDISMLSDKEIEYVNNYHTEVLNHLLPLLSGDDGEWLKNKCKPIKR